MNKIVLSEHLDVRIVDEPNNQWSRQRRLPKIEVFVNDCPVVTCVHVSVSLPEDELRSCQSVNELIDGHQKTEHQDVIDALDITPEELLQFHASNLQAWIENGYDSALIDARIAWPILRQLKGLDDKAYERYLESVLDRWQAGDHSSRKALLRYNHVELMELVERKEVDEDVVSLLANEVIYYRINGGSTSITRFVFDLQRPRDDPPSWWYLPPAIDAIIDEHGGAFNMRVAYKSVSAFYSKKITWNEFLQSLHVVKNHHVKHSQYITPDTNVYIKSGIISPVRYLALLDDGWHVIGQRWMITDKYKEKTTPVVKEKPGKCRAKKKPDPRRIGVYKKHRARKERHPYWPETRQSSIEGWT